jgi:hypothetical protein
MGEEWQELGKSNLCLLLFDVWGELFSLGKKISIPEASMQAMINEQPAWPVRAALQQLILEKVVFTPWLREIMPTQTHVDGRRGRIDRRTDGQTD